MRRSIPYLLIGLLCAAMWSCDKGNNVPDPTPTPPTRPDTLAAGWTKRNISGVALNDISFHNNSQGYVIADGAVFKSIDGGTTWSAVPISVANAINAVTTPDGKLFIVNNSGRIFRSTDGGATLTTTTFIGHSGIDDIFFLDNNNGFAIGDSVLYQTVNGGNNWTPLPVATGLTLVRGTNKSLAAVSSSKLWVTSHVSTFYSTTGIGNWAPGNLGAVHPYLSLFALNTSTVFIGSSDGKLYRSVDGGANFTLLKDFGAYGVNYLDIHFFDLQNGYICYGNRVYKTSDGGANWQVVAAMGELGFIELHFNDPAHGWACGFGGLVLKLN